MLNLRGVHRPIIRVIEAEIIQLREFLSIHIGAAPHLPVFSLARQPHLPAFRITQLAGFSSCLPVEIIVYDLLEHRRRQVVVLGRAGADQIIPWNVAR